MDPRSAARAVVAERVPGAVWAVLTGSVLGPRRTAGSDLDVVVMCDDGPGYRESLHFAGWPVELFVHTPQRLAGFLERERAARKPSTHRMLAHGVAVLGDPGDLPARCAAVLAAGPPAVGVAERERLRYGLTDLVDDLRHATDAGERTVIAATVWTETARVALLVAGCWVSHGKWLLRDLRKWDAGFAGRWLEARDDEGVLAGLAAEVLERAGGPLFDGYRA